MTLAALVDVGADLNFVEKQLQKLNVDESPSFSWSRVEKCGVSALKFGINIGKPSHSHRKLSDIYRLFDQSKLSPATDSISRNIFEQVAKAEAKIHGMPVDAVHFHEVGALDSIIDIVGISAALETLEIEQYMAAPIPLGIGMTTCAHGNYPIPALATLEILKGVPIRKSDIEMELTTPTGAAVLMGIGARFTKEFPEMIVENIGYGAGDQDLDNQPNVLRLILGQMVDEEHYSSESH